MSKNKRLMLPRLVLILMLVVSVGAVASAADIMQQDVTSSLTGTVFLDDAVTGGGDATVHDDTNGGQGTNFARFFDLYGEAAIIIPGVSGSLTVNDFGFASSATASANDATSVAFSFTYLGADQVVGGGDDVLIGTETVNYSHGGAGEYYVDFDSVLSAPIDGLGSRFAINVLPSDNDGGLQESIRFKTGPQAFETGNGAKFSVSGSFTPTAGPIAKWANAGSGNWNTASNWTSNPEVPGVGGLAGRDVLLGNAVAAETTVTLDVSPQLNTLTFVNPNSYTVTDGGGSNSITLTGSAFVNVAQGAHTIDATINGSAGLTKTGPGAVTLSGANTYTGTTRFRGGTIAISENNNLGNAANDIDFDSGTLRIEGTSLGTLSRDITMTGNGGINVDDASHTVNVTGTVGGTGIFVKTGLGTAELSNAAAFDGDIHVNEGNFIVSSNGGLGTATGVTKVDAAGGTVELDGSGGNLTINENFQRLQGRFAGVPQSHIRNTAGNNTLTGTLEASGDAFSTVRLENAAEGTTVTINNTNATPATLFDGADENVRFAFQGTGNFRVGNQATPGSGKIVGNSVDVVVNLDDPSDTVTIATAAASTDTTNATGSYWGGTTTVQSGTLEVLSDGFGNNGELISPVITVQNGATLDISDFGTYSLQVNQSLNGGGTVDVTGGTLQLFDDNNLQPGDSVGTLNVNGAILLNGGTGGGTLSYEIGNNPATVGGTENDLIAVTGALTTTGTPSMSLTITPVEAELGAGSYRLISHNGGATTTSGITPQVMNAEGDILNIRQSVSVSGTTAGQVNLVVTGSEESRTWNGTVGNNTWDVNASSNWSGGDQRFRDLDDVTFNNAVASRDVVVNTRVNPGSTTFSHTGEYNVTGGGGIRGAGAVNVNSGTVNLLNTGNNYSGTTTIASGATLNMVNASTGTIANNGTFRVGGIGQAGPNFVTTALQLNYDAGQDATGDGVWSDNAPAGGNVNLNFKGNDSTTVPVNDPTFQHLTAAYNISTSGGAISPGAQNTYFDSRGLTSGTFEVVFNVTNTAAGNEQVLMDIGGGRGVSLVLNGDVLTAGVNGDAVTTTGFSTGSLSTGWHHAVIVIGDTDPANGSNDRFTLYVNNAVVGTANTVDIDDYSGGNAWGFGGGALVVDPTNGTNQTLPAPSDYHGQIAIARYYQTEFSAGDVNQNFLALQDPSQAVGPASILVEGDFLQGAGSTLEMDVFTGLGNDFLDISGDFSADGDLIVSLVGDDPIAGDVFDLFDAEAFLGAFDNITLPTLGAGLSWNTSNLLITGELLVSGAAGDFDLDGDVDGADFLDWQRNLATPSDLADWQNNYGSGSSATANAGAVPEPATLLMLIACSSGLLAGRRRSR